MPTNFLGIDLGDMGAVAAIPIASIKIGKRFRADDGDIDSLAQSIADLGLLHPIVVTPDLKLVAGARRVRAHVKLDRTEIPAMVSDLDEVTRGEFAENMHRKDFTLSEAVAIADALKEHERAAARKRQVEAGKTTTGESQRLREIPSTLRARPNQPTRRRGRLEGTAEQSIRRGRSFRQRRKTLSDSANSLRTWIAPTEPTGRSRG
jgi:ParB/RepB/Spo0J family partition protein